MQRRAGGKDVVDDDIARGGVDGSSGGEDERPGYVLAALLSTEPGLRDGLVLLAKQRLSPAAGDEGGEPLGDAFGLIIPAVTPAGGVQGDGNQDGASQMAPEDLIFDGGGGEVIGQERAAFVFDAVDDSPSGSAGAEGADRPAERRPEVEAVRAGPVSFEDAFEGMAAGQATRIADPGEQGDAAEGEMSEGLIIHRLLRGRAVPGEDEVKEPPVEVSQPPHRVRPLASGVSGRAPRRSRRHRSR